jgi:predicted dehydrogenase
MKSSLITGGSLVQSLVPRLCPDLVRWNRYVRGNDLKVAIIGFGKMGILHSGILNLLVPGIVKAVVDKSFILTFGVSRLIRSLKFYRDIGGMLKEVEPDVVYVTTPTNSHYSIVKDLLEHGVKYVFVEKPPTVNYEQLEDLISTKKPGQMVMVGFQKRFSLTFRHAKLLLESGVIGDIVGVNSYIRSGDILEPTGRFNPLRRGVLLDLGVHLIDLLTWLFKIRSVIKAVSRSIYTHVDDMFIAELEADKGFRISIETSWSNPEYRVPETYIEVKGSQGTIWVTEDYLKVSASTEHPLLGNRRELILYKPHYYQGVPPVNLADPEYTIENIHFLESIHEGREPVTGIEEASETMKLVDELYREVGKTR